MKNKTIIHYDFEATSVARDCDPISIGLVAVTKTYKCNRKGCNIVKDVEWLDDICDCLEGRIVEEVNIKSFYGEFVDYNIDKCDQWVKDNIVDKLNLPYPLPYPTDFTHQTIKGTQQEVFTYLKEWLSQFESIEFFADYDVIDKPLLIDLIANWDKQAFNEFDEKLEYKYCGKSHKLRPVDSEGYYYYENQDDCVAYKVGLPKHLYNIQYYDFYDLHTIFKLKGIDPDINRRVYAFGYESDSYPVPDWLEGSVHNALYDAYVNMLCYDKLME